MHDAPHTVNRKKQKLSLHFLCNIVLDKPERTYVRTYGYVDQSNFLVTEEKEEREREREG